MARLMFPARVAERSVRSRRNCASATMSIRLSSALCPLAAGPDGRRTAVRHGGAPLGHAGSLAGPSAGPAGAASGNRAGHRVAVQAVQRTLGQWQGEQQALLNMEWTDDATA